MQISLLLISVLLLFLILHVRYDIRYLFWYLKMRVAYRSGLGLGKKKESRSGRVVASLSSIPSRLEHALPTINSLLLQSEPPDAIHLNLPIYSRREERGYQIPAVLEEDDRIIINRCDTDFGPITKLIPTLSKERDPDTLIVTVDDDTIYHPDMIRSLVRWHELNPGSALGFRGWDVPESGFYADSQTLFATDTNVPRPVDVLTGVSGVMYERRHFEDDFLDREDLPPESFFVDDICISGYLFRKRISRLLIPFRIREPFCRFIRSARSNPLWRVNDDGRNNQVMLHHFFGSSRVAPSPGNTLQRWYEHRVFPILNPPYQRIFSTHNQYLGRKSPPVPELRRILLMLLEELDRYLDAIQVIYWLDWGTLLGCVRDGKMIPWDNDIDVGIQHSDHMRVLEEAGRLPVEMEIVEISRLWPYQKLLPFLNLFPRKTFLRLVHRPSGLFVDIFEYQGEGRDLRLLPWVPWQKTRSVRDQGLKMNSYPREWILPVARGEFEGKEFPVPRRPEKILSKVFGEDYLIPDHRWDEKRSKWMPR